MGSVESAATQSERIRLHITPLHAELYDRIIPPSLQPLASGTSFHTIQTFPERGYGFVELPAMEAQKLKKKLNGSTLRGTKMSVEEARPAQKRTLGGDVDGAESERKRLKRERKERRKREEGVLAGHELEEGRRVKRGWTGQDSLDKEKMASKKGSRVQENQEGRKLRFKTSAPPNKLLLEGEQDKKKKKGRKNKKDKDDGKIVVEEFTKRRKSRTGVPAINGITPGSMSYEEGKGWVDEAGGVVEPEPRPKKSRKKRSPTSEIQPERSTKDAVGGAEQELADENPDKPDQSTASPPEVEAASPIANEDEYPPSSPSQPSTDQAKDVHPLEALFKRPAPSADPASAANNAPTKPRPAPIDTSFSFFDAGDADPEHEAETAGNGLPPATPHTRKDLEWRSLRSAAPTPETAAIGRKFSFPFPEGADEDEDEDGDEDGGDQGVGDAQEKGGEQGEGEESAFRKWFFENRGDLNRGWRKRRREERKVKRQRENRRLVRKVA